MISRRKRVALIAAAVLSLVLPVSACSSASTTPADPGSDELTLVRIGSQQVAADAGLFLADERGYFADAGIEVKFERLADASAITNALATGQLEVAGATMTPGTFMSVEQDLGIKIVGDKNYMAPADGDTPAISATRLAVLPEYDKGDITATLESLKGKRLAIHSSLSIQIVYLAAFLENHGFSLDDFQITPVLSPDQTAALQGGSIEAAVMQEPYLTQAITNDIAVEVSDLTDGLPRGVSTAALVYGPAFIEDAETAQAFMNAYMKAVREYNDAVFYGTEEEKRAVMEVVAERTGTPIEDLMKASPAGLDPDQVVDSDWIQHCSDFYQMTGDLAVDVDVADLIDTQFRDAAIKELGEYVAGS
ncbi:ABC transporter substrate-binding protein [Microbacterium pseudoresistens]|uniref:NitT/TauT family transport system substrate-binding protein n=1 Tax=Microbacterium pseudoresistens TaxID=640634 RepID=A0A7Y9JNR6_9MICO|nr:ABC transporter substrate-binding protein [Microbacterium pseudoresistens]NYD53979.1 NitT/TauT family transport system substrate-binding protein [Microbacterium pseudoresistens]